jgi:predicted RNA-binding Zn ribbon-like protein
MSDSAAQERSEWRDGFLFIGNHPILDFLNTCPVQGDKPQELLVDFNALLRWFRAVGLLSSRQVGELQRWERSIRAQTLTGEIRQLRERLRKDVRAWEDDGKLRGSTIAELNRLMSAHPMLAKLNKENRTVALESWFEAREPEDLIAPLAHSAAVLFARVPRERVRKCGHCILHFYDTSKKGTRRWCSMQLCGNRLKVAAYAARQRANANRDL